MMPAYEELVGPQSSVIALLASGVTRLVSGEGKKGEEMGLSAFWELLDAPFLCGCL